VEREKNEGIMGKGKKRGKGRRYYIYKIYMTVKFGKENNNHY